MEDAYVLQLSDRKFSDLYLCYCGYAKCEPLHSFGPAVRSNYLIHYILEGKCRRKPSTPKAASNATSVTKNSQQGRIKTISIRTILT